MLSAARAAVKRLTAEQGAPSWESFVDPLTDATEHLGRAWGVVGHLNAVVNTPELREAYNANIPRISEFWTEMGQNLELYARFKALAASPEHADYSAARKKIVSNDLRDFRLSGAELPQAEKSASPPSRRGWPSCPPSSSKTCWTPPTPSACT